LVGLNLPFSKLELIIVLLSLGLNQNWLIYLIYNIVDKIFICNDDWIRK